MRRKILCFTVLIFIVLLIAVFSIYGHSSNPEKEQLSVLVIGHSLGIDSTYLLPDIVNNNCMQDITVGMLYRSGCRLGQHVDYLDGKLKKYAYYEFDTSNGQKEWIRANASGDFLTYKTGDGMDRFIEDGTIAQSLDFALKRKDWDIIVLQAGVFEAANVKDSEYEVNIYNDINRLVDYVLSNDINVETKPKFAWNITWNCPSDKLLNDSYKYNLYNNFRNTDEMYNHIMQTFNDVIVNAYEWDYIIPSAIAMQNAKSSISDDDILYRDFIHASDYGRTIVAYTWYCTLFEEDIEECIIEPISSELVLDTFKQNWGIDYWLPYFDKCILIESVKNAMGYTYKLNNMQ